MAHVATADLASLRLLGCERAPACHAMH